MTTTRPPRRAPADAARHGGAPRPTAGATTESTTESGACLCSAAARAATQAAADHPLAATAAWHAVHRAAHAPYARAGRFARWFAAGKLAHDPVFRALLARGLIPPQARVLDLGCGQGLLASLLVAACARQRAGRWPAAWGPAPVDARYVGVDLMPRDIDRGRRALATAVPRPALLCEDICRLPLPPSDVIVALDVLHYVDPAAQHALLQRMHAALAPGGRLLVRVGDAAGGWRFRTGQAVDRIVTRLRGHAAAPTHTHALAEWSALLQRCGFALQSALPMSSGTPFANVLLVAARAAPSPAAPR